MSTEVDIRPHLRLPVFDPDYSRPQVINRLTPTNQQRETPSRDRRVTSCSSPSSSSTSEAESTVDDRGDDDGDSWCDRRPSIRASPASMTSERKAVSFDDDLRVARERGRTVAGRDLSRGGGRGGSGGKMTQRGGNREREGVERSNKKTTTRKWRSLSNADSQTQGTGPRHSRKRADEDADSKKGKRISNNGGRSSTSKPANQQVARTSNFTRFKYPVKFHRSVGMTPNATQHGLIAPSFDVPECMRRPSTISWLPVRQGPTAAVSQSTTEGRKSMTATRSTKSRTSVKRGNHDDEPTLEEIELNGVYHVVHADMTNARSGSGSKGGRRATTLDPEEGKDSDPDTMIRRQVELFSLSSHSSSSSSSEDDRDDNDDRHSRISRRSRDEDNERSENNRHKGRGKTMARGGRDDNGNSDSNDYSDDFVE